VAEDRDARRWVGRSRAELCSKEGEPFRAEKTDRLLPRHLGAINQPSIDGTGIDRDDIEELSENGIRIKLELTEAGGLCDELVEVGRDNSVENGGKCSVGPVLGKSGKKRANISEQEPPPTALQCGRLPFGRR
jgi:hypothetical protein